MKAAELREREEQRRAEDAARTKQLYGRRLNDVRLLQRRGFVVTKDGGDFMVGNKRVDGATLSAMADRERRLEGSMTTETNDTTCKCGKPIKHRGSCWARRGLSGPPEKRAKAVRKTAATRRAGAPAQRRRASNVTSDVAGIDALIGELTAKVGRLQGVIESLQAAKAVLKDEAA